MMYLPMKCNVIGLLLLQELAESRRLLDQRSLSLSALSAEAASLRESAQTSARRATEAEEGCRQARMELARERSRAEMLRMELANQDSIWTVKAEQVRIDTRFLWRPTLGIGQYARFVWEWDAVRVPLS